MDYTYKSILISPDFQAIHDEVDMSAMTDKAIQFCTWHEDTAVTRYGHDFIANPKHEKNPKKEKKLLRRKRENTIGEKGLLIVTWNGELSEDDKAILDGIVANI